MGDYIQCGIPGQLLAIKQPISTSNHLHVKSSPRQIIFTSNHLHVKSSSRQIIFTSNHLHVKSSPPARHCTMVVAYRNTTPVRVYYAASATYKASRGLNLYIIHSHHDYCGLVVCLNWMFLIIDARETTYLRLATILKSGWSMKSGSNLGRSNFVPCRRISIVKEIRGRLKSYMFDIVQTKETSALPDSQSDGWFVRSEKLINCSYLILAYPLIAPPKSGSHVSRRLQRLCTGLSLHSFSTALDIYSACGSASHYG
ncbi:hypothetical protein BDD12DRAFT_379914 [Trichophaea hybrida]|nr:hypothetical protein BDD12DRAFT_379914 [Trichophaea hybrida]